MSSHQHVGDSIESDLPALAAHHQQHHADDESRATHIENQGKLNRAMHEEWQAAEDRVQELRRVLLKVQEHAASTIEDNDDYKTLVQMIQQALLDSAPMIEGQAAEGDVTVVVEGEPTVYFEQGPDGMPKRI